MKFPQELRPCSSLSEEELKYFIGVIMLKTRQKDQGLNKSGFEQM